MTTFSVTAIADGFSVLMAASFVGIFVVLFGATTKGQERRNIAVILCLSIASAVFWSLV